MKKTCFILFVTMFLLSFPVIAQDVNYDENKIGEYTLPDPLTFVNGKKVKTVQDWKQRRLEILDIFQREMYGQMPPKPEALVLETLEEGETLAGFANRKQVRMWFKADKTGPKIDWLILTPKHVKGPVPTIILLNYEGNQTVLADKEILVTDGWLRNNDTWFIKNHKISEQSRGMLDNSTLTEMLPANMLIANGYAVVTACYGEISPDPNQTDIDENGHSLQETLAYTRIFDLWGKRDPNRTDNTTALSAWAWALMRGMDMIEQDPVLDEKHVVLTGFSRLGKAALIAGAFDERFPVVIPNQTGGGGAPLAKRYYGENVGTMTTSFTHWYCKAYAKYAHNEASMPFDQHMFLACVAPRKLLIQGFDEPWFDTKGEFLALQAASPVWEFLGKKGLPKVDWPADFDTSAIGTDLGYVRRNNKHGIAAIDWVWILQFAEKAFKESK